MQYKNVLNTENMNLVALFCSTYANLLIGNLKYRVSSEAVLLEDPDSL